jgi:hypothetical protein
MLIDISKGKGLAFTNIFKFWMPLASTWLMMSFEGPFLTALVARMVQPEFNLAAYGVAFSFAMIVEAPVIMLMSASTALVKDKYSFLKLRTFVYTLNIIVTCIMLILILPPIFYFISIRLIGLPANVAALTHTAMVTLIPWPAAIGYRRFYQGILIRNNLTRRVAFGTALRVTTILITGILLYTFAGLDGVVVGTSSLSAAVLAEAVASKFMAMKTVNKIKSESSFSRNSENLTYGEIIKFYYPLALTSFLTLGVNPMVTFFIGQSRFVLESLAVLPVINAFIFIFKSFGVSYQEAAIALIGEKKEGYTPLRNFAFILGSTAVLLLIIVVFTPLANLYLVNVSGLSETLAVFAKTPLALMFLLPGLEVLISFQRAVLVDARKTSFITKATIIEVTGIIVTLFIGIRFFNSVGAVIAAIAFAAGRLGANTYLSLPFYKIVKSYPERSL